MPGDPQSSSADLLTEAAAGHEQLLRRSVACSRRRRDSSLALLLELLDDPALRLCRRRLFCHPLLIEALHASADRCPVLAAWHRQTAVPEVSRQLLGLDTPDLARLGSILLPLLVRRDPGWCGRIEASTDLFGGVHFPLCDWSIVLQRESRGTMEVLAGERVTIQVGPRDFACLLGDVPFLRTSRRAAALVLLNSAAVELTDVQFPSASLRPRLQHAPALGSSGVRYHAVCFEDRSHAALTGALIASVLEAVRGISPVVGEEFCSCIQSVRGFELPGLRCGTIQSFSTPTQPGLMGINVRYTAAGDPQLDPFCFTWFAHELGHTKHYLIDTVAYHNGWTFLRNPGELSRTIPRYGRSLPVRTLFQLPYTHLYEWVLLMDFMDAGWHGLPWDIDDDPLAAGDAIQSEIEEAFDLIADSARLTAWGQAAVRHLRKLFHQARDRWRVQCCAPVCAT